MQLGYKKVYRDPLGFPGWEQRNLPVEVKPAGLAGLDRQPEAPGVLYGWAMIWTLLGIFAGGMALNLTPCVYPLIPVTISYFGGRSDRRQLIGHGLCYIGGLSITNSILGVVAALTGTLMGALLQNPLVLTFVAVILIGLAASLFGLWELRVPSGLMQAASKTYAGYFGTLFMGLTMGVVAAPCIGPFVLGLLTWVASMGSPWLGFIVFFTLSLGLGLPLFCLAVFSGNLSRLPRSGEWMLWVRKLMGWVLVGMAVYFIKPVLPEMAGFLLPALIALSAGIHLGWIDKTKATFRSFEWIRSGVAIAAVVIATLIVGNWLKQGPAVDWQPYSEQLLAEAKHARRPVMIDFSADWCSPCREMDTVTFRHPDVVAQAQRHFTLVKVDVTRGGDPMHERLLQDYNVKGVPTIVFLNAQGEERLDLRLVDFMPPDQFLNHITGLPKSAAGQ